MRDKNVHDNMNDVSKQKKHHKRNQKNVQNRLDDDIAFLLASASICSQPDDEFSDLNINIDPKSSSSDSDSDESSDSDIQIIEVKEVTKENTIKDVICVHSSSSEDGSDNEYDVHDFLVVQNDKSIQNIKESMNEDVVTMKINNNEEDKKLSNKSIPNIKDSINEEAVTMNVRNNEESLKFNDQFIQTKASLNEESIAFKINDGNKNEKLNQEIQKNTKLGEIGDLLNELTSKVEENVQGEIKENHKEGIDDSSCDESEAEEDEIMMEREILQRILDEEEAVRDVVLKVKNEVLPEELPDDEEVIKLPEKVILQKVGVVANVVEKMIVIRGDLSAPCLDAETALFLNKETFLGRVFDTFGPVKCPFYSIRLSSKFDASEVTNGLDIFFVPYDENLSKYVFVEDLKKLKGSDASWSNDIEPPPKFLDYSDDEEEREVKKKIKEKKKAERKERQEQEAHDSSESEQEGEEGEEEKVKSKGNKKVGEQAKEKESNEKEGLKKENKKGKGTEKEGQEQEKKLSKEEEIAEKRRKESGKKNSGGEEIKEQNGGAGEQQNGGSKINPKKRIHIKKTNPLLEHAIQVQKGIRKSPEKKKRKNEPNLETNEETSKSVVEDRKSAVNNDYVSPLHGLNRFNQRNSNNDGDTSQHKNKQDKGFGSQMMAVNKHQNQRKNNFQQGHPNSQHNFNGFRNQGPRHPPPPHFQNENMNSRPKFPQGNLQHTGPRNPRPAGPRPFQQPSQPGRGNIGPIHSQFQGQSNIRPRHSDPSLNSDNHNPLQNGFQSAPFSPSPNQQCSTLQQTPGGNIPHGNNIFSQHHPQRPIQANTGPRQDYPKNDNHTPQHQPQRPMQANTGPRQDYPKNDIHIPQHRPQRPMQGNTGPRQDYLKKGTQNQNNNFPHNNSFQSPSRFRNQAPLNQSNNAPSNSFPQNQNHVVNKNLRFPAPNNDVSGTPPHIRNQQSWRQPNSNEMQFTPNNSKGCCNCSSNQHPPANDKSVNVGHPMNNQQRAPPQFNQNFNPNQAIVSQSSRPHNVSQNSMSQNIQQAPKQHYNKSHEMNSPFCPPPRNPAPHPQNQCRPNIRNVPPPNSFRPNLPPRQNHSLQNNNQFEMHRPQSQSHTRMPQPCSPMNRGNPPRSPLQSNRPRFHPPGHMI